MQCPIGHPDLQAAPAAPSADIAKDEHQSAGFLSVNPMGQIPALVLPDGTLMTESAAMLLHLTDNMLMLLQGGATCME